MNINSIRISLFAALVLSSMVLAVESTGKAAPLIDSATAMDRWVDLKWTFEGNAPGGFGVSMSVGGHDFPGIEQVSAEERKASVFIMDQMRSLLKPGEKVAMRVSALGVDGKPLAGSEPVFVDPAKARDIEMEIRTKFDYPVGGRPYNQNDPATKVVYTAEQKQSQREAAKAMFAKLKLAAESLSGPRHFTIEPGLYRVEVNQFKLSKISDFTIHAPGVEIIMDSAQNGAAFVFGACTNVTLTGRAAATSLPAPGALVFDSEQLPMSVSRIVSCDVTNRTVDVEILPGYSTNICNEERMLAYDATGRLLNTCQMGWREAKPVGLRIIRLSSPAIRDASAQKTIFQPGILLALKNKLSQELCQAYGCLDMTFESVRIYSGGGAPADHGNAGYTIYRDWRLLVRPGTSRLPVSTGLGQFSKNGGAFVFEDCEFGPHHDDGINLLSGMSIVGKSDGGKAVLVTGRLQPTVGSTLTFFDYKSWKKLGEAKVVASTVVKEPEAQEAVNAFSISNRSRFTASRAYQTTLDRPLKLAPFAMVVHSDYRADSITVRGCLFRDQQAQIMLLQGAKSGLIENNLLLRSAGTGIHAHFSQYWGEGPMPSHLFIRNNVILDNPVSSGINASIGVFPGSNYPTEARLFTDIRVEGNRIVNPACYGVWIANSDRVVIRHNRIVNPGALPVTWVSYAAYKNIPIPDLQAAICLGAVSHAEVTDNEIVFGNPRCRRAVLVLPTCDSASIRVERNHEQVLDIKKD